MLMLIVHVNRNMQVVHVEDSKVTSTGLLLRHRWWCYNNHTNKIWRIFKGSGKNSTYKIINVIEVTFKNKSRNRNRRYENKNLTET